MKLQRTRRDQRHPGGRLRLPQRLHEHQRVGPGHGQDDPVSGDGGVGTTYDNTSKFMGRETELTYEVVTHQPDRLFALRGENKSVVAHDTMEIARRIRVQGHLHRRLRVQGARQVRRPAARAGAEEARRRRREGPARGPGEALRVGVDRLTTLGA